MPHEGAAARAERQAFDVILLRAIRRHAVHRADRRRPGIADGKRADLARGRQILLEERRRHFQHVRDVVEPVRLVVRGKKRRGVDVECQHVVNGGRVLGAVQAMKRRAARVRLRERRAIDRGFERRRERVDRRFLGPGHALRRHHAAVELPNDFFPDVRAIGDARQVDRVLVEHETAGLEPRVVAADAVLVDKRALRRDVGRSGRRSRGMRGDGPWRLPAYRR